MIYILIAIIAIIVLSLIGIRLNNWGLLSDLLCPLFAAFGFVALFIYAILVYEYVAASYQKDIINREYHTNYTQAEVFYASNVIDTIRELDRKRVELNGDLIK